MQLRKKDREYMFGWVFGSHNNGSTLIKGSKWKGEGQTKALSVFPTSIVPLKAWIALNVSFSYHKPTHKIKSCPKQKL